MFFFLHSISVTYYFKIPYLFGIITHLSSLNIFYIICGLYTCHSVQVFFLVPKLTEPKNKKKKKKKEKKKTQTH